MLLLDGIPEAGRDQLKHEAERLDKDTQEEERGATVACTAKGFHWQEPVRREKSSLRCSLDMCHQKEDEERGDHQVRHESFLHGVRRSTKQSAWTNFSSRVRGRPSAKDAPSNTQQNRVLVSPCSRLSRCGPLSMLPACLHDKLGRWKAPK